MDKNEIAKAIRSTLISPNVSDSNSEAANVVDVIHMVAVSIEAHGKDVRYASKLVADAINNLAAAVCSHLK